MHNPHSLSHCQWCMLQLFTQFFHCHILLEKELWPRAYTKFRRCKKCIFIRLWTHSICLFL